LGLCLEGRYTLILTGTKQLKLADVATNEVLATFPLVALPHRITRYSCLDRAVVLERLIQQHLGPDPGPYEGYANRVGPCVALSADGRLALHCSSLGKLTVLDVATGAVLRSLEGHTAQAVAVGLSADGAIGLSGGLDNTLRVWDTATGRCLRTIETTQPITAVALSPDARFALAAAADGTVKFWHVGCHEKPWAAPVVLCGLVASETVLEYDRHMQEARAAAERNDFTAAAEHLRSARAQPGCDRRPEALRAWQDLYPHLCREAFRGVWEEKVLDGGGILVHALTVSPDGHRAAVAGVGPVLLWDLDGGKLAGMLPSADRIVRGLAFSADEQQLILEANDRSVERWDLATERLLKSFPGQRGAVAAVSLSAAGDRLLSGGSNGKLMLWDVASGRRKRSFAARGELHAAMLSADGTLAAAGTVDGDICVWQADRGRLVRRWRAHEGPVTALCFSRDGRRLLSGGADRAVRVWEIASGSMRTLRGHGQTVTSVSSSEDGRFALSGSEDRALRLWDLESGACVHTFVGHTAPVRAALLGPDGRFALSADLDGKIRLWLLDWDLGEPSPTPGAARRQPAGEHVELPLSGLSLDDGRLRKWTASGTVAEEHALRDVRKVRLRQQRNRPGVGRWVFPWGLLLSVIGVRYGADLVEPLRPILPIEFGVGIPLIIVVAFLTAWLVMSSLAWLFTAERSTFLEVRLPHDTVRYRLDDPLRRCRAFVRQLRRRVADARVAD
jgi:WD40 repeat protein